MCASCCNLAIDPQYERPQPPTVLLSVVPFCIENNYSSLLRDELPKCNLIDGIETYLELIIKKTTNLNVLSGGDRKEVLDILEKRTSSISFARFWVDLKKKNKI